MITRRTYLWRAMTGLSIGNELFAKGDLRNFNQHPRTALVIGNSHYSSAPLKNPKNDARAMGTLLKDLGFLVQLAEDSDAAEMKRMISVFYTKLTINSIALLYYAGHGMQIEGRNYLLPVDILADEVLDVRSRSLIVDEVLEKMAEKNPAFSLLFLDACRDNPFNLSRSFSVGLAGITNPSGTSVVLFAASPGKTVDDNPHEKNSLFTSALLEVMPEPGLSLKEIVTRVYNKVLQSSYGRQRPWVTRSASGEAVDFYFLPAGKTAKDLSQYVPEPVAPRPVRDKYALLVGISAFQDKSIDPLRSPAKDTMALADVLIDPNIGRFPPDHVLVLVDREATLTGIKKALNFLAAKVHADDEVLIYFSSHGTARELDPEGITYLLAYDTDISSSDALYATALPMIDLGEFFRSRLRADRSLLLLDVGHAYLRSLWAESEQITAEAPTSNLEERGNVVISASRTAESAFESSSAFGSVFMSFLLEGVKASRGRITALNLYNYISSRVFALVRTEFNQQQHPVLLMGGIHTAFDIGQPIG